MKSVTGRLSGAALGLHIADQTALVAVPLIAAVVFGATPQVIGLLVACQTSAHLFGSLPLGLLVDQGHLRRLAVISAMISLIGSCLAVGAIVLGVLPLFGVAVALSGFGVVLFGLTSLSIVPRIAGAAGLARANSALEVPRAVSSFAVPLSIGLLITTIPAWGIMTLAVAGAALACVFTRKLPAFEVLPKTRAPIFEQIREGGAFLLGHPLLRPIALCALFWNLAFAALLVVLVPAIQSLWMFPAGAFGGALAAFGFGAILGSWLSGRISELLPPSVILMFGPGSSAVAVGALLFLNMSSADRWLYLCFCLLGFGPSMWLVAQNSVRQIVSPPDMLGRVNAVIQTAIYGVRPLGALLGGYVAGTWGSQEGVALVTVLFALSFCAAAFSGLRRVQSFATLAQISS